MTTTLYRLAKKFGVRRTAGLILLATLVALRIYDPLPLESLRLKSFDIYQIIKPRDAELRPVVIVDIDEASLRELGQWPWPRTLVADLVTKLSEMGSAGIAFDVIFAEEDRLSPARAADSFRNIDDETLQKLRSMPSNDQIMAEAMRPAKVVLGQSGVPVATPTAPAGLPQTGFAMLGPDPSPFLVTFPGLLRNIPILERAAAGRGVLTIRSERDGIVRRVPLVMKAGDILVPAMTLELLRVVTKSGAIRIKTDPAGLQSVAVPGLEIPTDRNGMMWVNFAPHDGSRYVSARDVLNGTVPADRINGRLVLIGTSAVGLLDIKTTPLDAAIPGVEIQAQILENVLTGAVLSYPNYAVAVELLSAILFGSVILVFAPMIGALPLLILGFAVGAALTALSWYFYSERGLLFDLSFPLLSSFILYVTVVFINYFREQKDRQRIRSAFGQYLSPTLVEQLAQSPEKLQLGGETRTMTIMFSDVRGFTAISESFRHDPQGLTQLMNRFLTPLTNAIIEEKGTIDKYMGDAIMAFWNAPIDDPEHEINACKAALAMLRKVDALNAEREIEANETGQRFIPIRIGVGLNTGQCVVGNMGSDLRFDYSVLGDSVNLASRLEGRSKSYGTPIIIGSGTAAKVAGKFATLEIDLITVKGKTEPERIYTVLGDEAIAASSEYRTIRELTERMLAAYRRRDWNSALEALQLARHSRNDFELDEVYALYLARIHDFQKEAPPEDWNGVYAFDTK
ncbi:MAG TPA: adenylate/guanylate cyclase domain-containing protein [Pseudorhodoplanes sp.]|nr:adenylate/guanylate cyclase domain-containing protein [Pseudorhodoplanes sp.]